MQTHSHRPPVCRKVVSRGTSRQLVKQIETLLNFPGFCAAASNSFNFESVIKRFTIALLATVYLIAAVGVTISGHFCGGYLESYSFSITPDEHDCCGGMPMDNNCCENKQVTIKSSENHFASSIVQLEQHSLFVAVPVFTQEFLMGSSEDVVLTPVLHPPPLFSRCPVHLKNRVLII